MEQQQPEITPECMRPYTRDTMRSSLLLPIEASCLYLQSKGGGFCEKKIKFQLGYTIPKASGDHLNQHLSTGFMCAARCLGANLLRIQRSGCVSYWRGDQYVLLRMK